MSRHRELILGGPGCGKTTKLLQFVEYHLEQGVTSDRIAYLAFTRKAAAEARLRARERFGFGEKEMPYFKTLHALAFSETGISYDQLMTSDHYDKLGDFLKLKFGSVEDEFGQISEQRERGSQLYHIEQQARLRRIDLKAMCSIDGRQGFFHVGNFQKSLEEFKRQYDVFDYTDILEMWAAMPPKLPVEVLIIDEVQDLSPLQWLIVDQLVESTPYTYYAGDDDQAIYEWAGADVKTFLNLKAQRTVLPVSHRLPVKVFDKCTKILKKIKHRYPKDWKPTDREGALKVVGAPELAPLGTGEWLVLARNHYLLETSAAFLRAKGLAFIHQGKSSLATPDGLAVRAWVNSQDLELLSVADVRRILAKYPTEKLLCDRSRLKGLAEDSCLQKEVLQKEFGVDLSQPWEKSLRIAPDEKSYLKSVLAKEGSLEEVPRIKLSTIHGVKGGEADNVLLLPDMSTACYESYMKQSDSEARVFYVGASRAKQQLIICQPQARNYFPL